MGIPASRHGSEDLPQGVLSITAAWAVCGMLFPLAGWYCLARAWVAARCLLAGGRRASALAGVACICTGVAAQMGYLSLAGCSISRAREMAPQTVCGTRLSGIGKALGIYVWENRDSVPCMVGPDGRPPATFDDDPESQKTFDDFWAHEYDCNLQAMWLLVHSQQAGENIFGCASDRDYIEVDHTYREYGFGSWRSCSFAFQPMTHHFSNKGFPGAPEQDSAAVIGGDKQIGAGRYTLNHAGGGNFLAAGYSVRFAEEEWNFVGWSRNQAYLRDVIASGEHEGQLRVNPDADEPGPRLAELQGGVMPEHCNDSVLFWKDDPGKTPSGPEDGQGPLLWGWVLGLLWAGGVVIGLIMVFRYAIEHPPSASRSGDGAE